MRKFIPNAVVLIGWVLVAACNTATPEKYFDIAVLNSNMFVGFANEGQLRELESPSAKMVDGKTVAMQRMEVLNAKIQYLAESYGKLKALKETEDAKDILQASSALYEYVLPVYKNEYTQLAEMYDKNSSKEQIAFQAKGIQDKYFARYDELYQTLIIRGKLYAEKHHIQVNWAR